MSTAVRYALMQLPGELFLAVLLYLLVEAGWFGWRVAVAAFVLWVLKDVLLYPLYRHALREGPPIGADALVGDRAVVVTDLRPCGRVLVRSERWRACTRDGRCLPRGAEVSVVAADGLTLVVTPEPPEAGAGHGTAGRAS